jgi:hypothetical protein
MRQFTLILGCFSMFSACVKAIPGESSEHGRVYELSEVRTQALVFEAMEKQGVTLVATGDPHVLASARRGHETFIVAEADEDRPFKKREQTIFTEEQQWVVVFKALGPKATAVQVRSGTAIAWADSAERNTLVKGPPPPQTTVDELAINAKRNPEAEAWVAASLDGQVDVTVSDTSAPEKKLEAPEVMALKDPDKQMSEKPNIPSSNCGVNLGGLEPFFLPGHLVLLSDPIGAEEPLAVLKSLVCEAHKRQLPLTVGLPLSTEQQFELNTYLSSEGTAPDDERLLASPFWVREWQDGRSSAAMFDFIRSVRKWRHQGVAVTALAIDSNSPGNTRQALVASKLLKSRVEHPKRLMVALLGNALVSKRRGAAWDANLFPVGARLAAVLPEQTHVFDSAFEPGLHWSCKLGEKGWLNCGTWSAIPGPKQRVDAVGSIPFFRLNSSVSNEGFDGIYYVGGALHRSAPAVLKLAVDHGRPELLDQRGTTKELVPIPLPGLD